MSTDDLLERETELERIRADAGNACAGEGRVILIEASPGLGKTSLLEAATAIAGDRMLCLSARATELESEFPFGIVRQLLEPMLRSQGRRAQLLAGAAAPAAPALGLSDERAGTAARSFAALNALYWVVAGLAEEQPLLIAVDDAHWADQDSLRFLAFLVPRIAELPVLLIVTARAGEWRPEELFAATASDPASRALQPAELSAKATVSMVEGRFGSGTDEAFAVACHRATGGNPFYLRMLLDELIREGSSPSERAAGRVLTLGPRAVTQAIVARLARISPAASRLAHAVAVLGDDADRFRAARLAGLDPAEAREAASALLDAGIIEVADDLRFAHPIIRNAVYRDIGRAARTELHGRALELLREAGADPERVVAHLLAIDPARDPEAVASLREAAGDALRRGAVGSAVAYLRRALAEPPPEGARGELLLELGSAEALVDGRAAIGHLDEALEVVRAPRRRAVVAMVLARTLFSIGEGRRAVRAAAPVLAELGDGDGEVRRRLQAQVLAAGRMEPTLVAETEALAERVRAAEALDGEGYGAKALTGNLAWIDARACVPAEQARRDAERALEGRTLIDEGGGADFVGAVLVLIQADSERALPALRSAVAAARERGDAFGIAVGRVFACLAHLQRGELADAIAAGEEGLAAIDSYGIAVGLPWGAGYLAEALVDAGDRDAAEVALARADPPDEASESTYWLPHLWGRARLASEAGDLEAALELALECGRRFEAVGGRNPAFVPWRSHAAVWLSGLGSDPDRAGELAGEELALARAWGAPRALGAALRAAGIVAGGEAGVARLREAVTVLDDSPAKLEYARALVDLGAAVRRSGRRAEAREPLREGMAAARGCGAVPLAERAYEELRATGARPRKLIYAGVEALTPSERRVASLAAGGMTNREIAQELFISVKTVEWHLGQIYRKLEIGSRRDLRVALEAG